MKRAKIETISTEYFETNKEAVYEVLNRVDSRKINNWTGLCINFDKQYTDLTNMVEKYEETEQIVLKHKKKSVFASSTC